jgi:hypothetical protein
MNKGRSLILVRRRTPSQHPHPDIGGEVPAYRSALWRWWELTAQGAEADHTEVQAVYNEIIRHIDELGPTSATELRHAWELEWFKETGRCPRCGNEGGRHL